MDYVRLGMLAVRLSIMHELQYRSNLVLQLLHALLQLGSGLAGLALVLSHTASIGGWSAAELVAQLGVYMLIGGVISMLIQPNMEQLVNDVYDGTLDFILLKPADAQAYTSLRQMHLWQGVDIMLGAAVVLLAGLHLNLTAHPERLLLFSLLLCAGGMMIYSFWLVLATCAFWVRLPHIFVIFQDMYTAGRWPITIYPRWLRLALTFLVPVAFATTIPTAALTGRLTTMLLILTVVFACGLVCFSRAFWLFGLRRYTGASA